MATRVDLGGIEAGVRAYLEGVAPSTGWTLLDLLERYLVAEMIEPGTTEEQRARKYLAAIRTKLGPDEEVAETSAALSRVIAEYQAGLAGYVPGDVGLWRALVGKLIEKKMYEARLKAAQART
jgi:hypothetical protein